jgi:hypothetical protein
MQRTVPLMVHFGRMLMARPIFRAHDSMEPYSIAVLIIALEHLIESNKKCKRGDRGQIRY